MRLFMTSIVLLVSAGLLVASAEAKGNKKNKDTAVSGTISSVAADGGSFVLTAKGKKKGGGGGDQTLTINAATTIEVNGVTGKATDLQPGMKAKVKVSGGAATDIKATNIKQKKKKK